MLILYSVDTSFERRPVANWLVFGGLILAFLIQIKVGAESMERFSIGGGSKLSVLSYSWIHLSIWLMIFNLVFLWPMGNAVCAMVGNWQYLVVFLAANFLGGLIHLLIGSGFASGIGAALACAAGMYLVFFPEIPMNCLFFFPRPETVALSTYFVVPLWFVADFVLAMVGLKGVTYVSHFLGFLAGVSIAVVSLRNKWVEMGKGERSLLDVLEKRKIEVEDAIKETAQSGAEEKKEEFLERPAESAVLEALPGARKIEPERGASAAGDSKAGDDFIRFYCVCGQRIKVPKSYGGKAGRCPKCKSLVRIP